jgi:putative transposase
MTAMKSLEQGGPVVPEIPRFDDGMVNLQELIRMMAEALVNEIMDAQADEACADGNSRNGYRRRTLVTSVGAIELRIPKLRMGTYYPDDLLVKYSRVDRAVIAAVSEMVANGVSTRKVEKVAHALGIDRMSASQVSRVCESLDEVVEDLQTRAFEGVRFPYLWLDATYMKCRDGGHVSSTALVTAIACGDDGYRRLVGLDAVDTESYLGWRGFLQSLRERGVEGVACVTSDAHEGLRRAIVEVFPGAAWQRCIVHLERNAMSLARNRRQRAAVGTILHAVFAERDPALVRELYHLAVDEIGGFCPKAAELLEEAEPDALAYLDFPYDHHRRLRTNNVQERANREIKRRSRVVQVFPSRRSLIRMVGAVLSEMDG